jgi:hypothetical protein
VSYTAVVKIAAVATLERHNSEVWNRPGRQLYEPGSLKFAPGRSEVPLLVNHDDDRGIGVVHELFQMDWTEGPGICARATVTDPPGWLKRGTRASFRESVYRRRGPDFGPADRVVGAIVGEVSVLAPGVAPAEPLAEVLLYREAEARPPARSVAAVGSSGRAAATGVVTYGGKVIRRPCGGKVLAIR